MQKNENCKTERIYFRVTKYEKMILSRRAKAAGLTLSKYILTVSERKRLINPEPIVRLMLEVNHIGNNINQIARVANTNKDISPKQIEILQKQMEYLKKRADDAMKLTFEHEKEIMPHSPDTIKYRLEEITSLVYEILNNLNEQDSEK